MAALFGLLAFLLAVMLGLALAYCFHTKGEIHSTQQDMMRVKHKAQVALARYQGIADLEKYKAELEGKLRNTRSILPKFETLAEMERHKNQLSETISKLDQKNAQLEESIASQESTLSQLAARTEAVEEAMEMQSFGFYRPKYGFEDSESYANQLSTIRDEQKAIVKSGEATNCEGEWTVDGDPAKGRKLVGEQAKLMLRAFNGECDAAVAKVKYNNVNHLETRINRSFDAINKLGKAKKLTITREYLNHKLQELYLVYEHREKIQQEREEQREIKERMREEAKALKEIEKAKKEAEQEETAKTQLLEKAREDLAKSQGNQTDRLKTIVDKLEKELKDALQRKAKAIARAQLTRSGHVYVLSNVGSFGEGVYKIGMTRRLDPMERVKELGDASVPFQYDVHAMIYSENAPALENSLHKHLALTRINMVNLRREFFRTTLDEIRDAIKKNFGEITFATVPRAEEYRRSLAIYQGSSGSGNKTSRWPIDTPG